MYLWINNREVKSDVQFEGKGKNVFVRPKRGYKNQRQEQSFNTMSHS
jgi:hypothetical protein